MISLYFCDYIFQANNNEIFICFVALCFVLMAVYPLLEARYERLITGDDSVIAQK